MSERQEERLEPSLEREGAGGRLRSALPLATEGTQEVPSYEEGVGVDGGSQGFALRRKVLASLR